MKHLFSFGRCAPALLLLAVAPLLTHAQNGVGIGTTAPDVSAALDIVSSDKGALLPRVAAATAIATPATGLIVYQTGGTAGFYYNAGTPAAPSWQPLGAAVTASNGLTKTGASIGLGGTLTQATNLALGTNNLTLSGAGLLGLGTTAPAARLDIQGGADANGNGSPVALAFSWYSGGYRHFVRSRHNGNTATGGNDLDFYLNNSTTATGSSAPGAGNIPVLTLENYNSTPRVGIGSLYPTQALEVAGQVYSNAGGFRFPDNTVQTTAAAGAADNLGNHTATQNLNLGTNQILGNGSTAGISISANGGLVIGQAPGYNVMMGTSAGSILNVASSRANTYVGTGAGNAATITTDNTFVGYVAGFVTTTGGSNTFVGSAAGVANTTGARSALFGTGAGNSNTTGNDNTLLGFQAGISSTTGSNVTIIGADAGFTNTTGSNITLLGAGADVAANNLSNATAIGASAQVSQSNSLVLGSGANVGIGTSVPSARLHVAGTIKIDAANTLELGAGVAGKEVNAGKIGYRVYTADALDITGAGTATSNRKIKFWAEGGATFAGSVTGVGAYNSSDQRLKQDIRPLTGALALVQRLHGRRYQWNALGVQRGGQARAEQVGVLAQELEQVLPELVNTDADGYKAVNYAQLTPVLIEAIKELKAENDALKQQAAADKAQTTATTAAFEARLRALEAGGVQARK